MKQKKLIIFGADDFAQLAKFYFDLDSDYEVSAFVVDPQYCDNDLFCGLPLVSSDIVNYSYPSSNYDMFIAMGYANLNEMRELKYNEYKSRGYKFARYISSKATCWYEGNEFGDNVFVLEDNTIQPYSRIDSDTVLWSGNHIGHHAHIGKHVFITSHVVVSGRAEIGDNTFIGVNATINDHIHVADHNAIGSGALITRDTDPYSMYKAKWTPKSDGSVKESKYFYVRN